MARINKNVKQRIVKALAGITAVCLSPFLASAVTGSVPGISALMDGAAQYVGENISLSNSPAPLRMNDSTLLLYKPDGGGVITESLPPVNSPRSIETQEENNINADTVLNTETAEEKKESSESLSETDMSEQNEDTDTAEVMSRNISVTKEDLSGFNSEDGHIVNTTFEPALGTIFINLDGAGQVRNETALDNQVVIDASRENPGIILELNGKPEILIMHTHTSEAYQPDGNTYYDSSYTCRSLDSEKNIVAVGAEIANSLAEAGITVIHDGTIHDSPEYSGSYARSEETVRKILAEYPSVKVVLDIHRDAIEDETGSMVAAVTNIDGKNAAQVMIISAADNGTYNIPEYMENFKLAALLQRQMESDYPGITRPVLFQYCHYNQQLTTGSLLIEVGSHGNSLEQAKYSGKLIGKSIAEALLSLKNSIVGGIDNNLS